MRDWARKVLARMRGHDVYLDSRGLPRATRDIFPNEIIEIPMKIYVSISNGEPVLRGKEVYLDYCGDLRGDRTIFEDEVVVVPMEVAVQSLPNGQPVWTADELMSIDEKIRKKMGL